MPLPLRLAESEQEALRFRAEADGISMQEATRRAVREFVARGDPELARHFRGIGGPDLEAIISRLDSHLSL